MNSGPISPDSDKKSSENKLITKDPDKQDIEVDLDQLNEEFSKLFKPFMPYQRHIMIYGMIVLIMLVVFLGYAYGGMKVCSELDGILDDNFTCHPDFQQDQQRRVNSVGQVFMIPNFTEENGD